MQPLISIILPVYNIEQYIDKCMESLLKQTYKNCELLLIDDGSTDNSGIKCDEYASIYPNVYVFHKQNGGLSDARNYGIKRAAGNYITCVDPDDYVDKDYLEYLYYLIHKYNVDMSICQHRVHYDNGSIKEFGSTGEELLSAKVCVERMLYHDVIDTSAWAKLYKKDLFEKIEYPYGKLFEDIATTYKLMIKSSQIAVGYESKYNYIFHNNSIVNSCFKPAKLDLLEMTDNMGDEIGKIFPELSNAILRRRVYSRISTLNQMLNTSEYDKKKEEIIAFIKKNSWQILKNKKAPLRDKIALIFLLLNFELYKNIWIKYQSNRMNGDKND